VLYSVFREVRGVFSTLAGRKRGVQEEQNKREKGTLTSLTVFNFKTRERDRLASREERGEGLH